MGVMYRKFKKKGRKMKNFIFNLFNRFRSVKQRSLIWNHIHNEASCGVIGYSARDRKIAIRGHDGY
tara:strand:+ start:183 stop:380 length:198 start_codon:yes stop_codon:yes gene_type:complete